MSENPFQKTFDPKTIEEKFYKMWEESGAFAARPESNAAPYALMMPPPNVTGSLHMGHALNMTLQDILTRYHRMRGHDTLWQPGTDHAGIATQMVVERQLGEKGVGRRDLGREKFLEKVWEWKEESGGTIVTQLKRLGATPDWPRERFTMDEGLNRAVTKVFVQLYREGLIYKDKRLVNWDPKLLTAVSDLEVEHKEIKGKFYHFRYPYEDGTGFIAIATTRPETILADGAVAVHPDDERYRDVIGRNVIVPIINRVIPVIADEHVKADFGSGAVKITAAHDFNDFDVYKRHPDAGIPLINLFTPDGKMNENCPPDYQGLDRFAAREKVVTDFEALGLLDKIEDHVHKVPYGDRSGTVIEPYLTDQWYCDAATLAQPALKAVEQGRTVFIPKSWENTYFEWMRNIQPWCISRQLWWGHRIPAWYGPDNKAFVAESAQEVQTQAEAFYGHAVELTRDEDVLDTWFSSALWPFSTLGWPDKTQELAKYYPGDVLVTGFDIIFFWVARMMMMGLHFMDDVPFKTVYIHALVRDAKGQKMSKSKGNVMDPLELIDRYGADALRFTMAAMAAQGRDIKLSEERVQGYRNFATKLWNATRYCSMNRCIIDPAFDPANVTYVLNQWVIGALSDMKSNVETALAQYRFNDAATALYQFVWGTFCDWYLEFTKPILFSPSTDVIPAGSEAASAVPDPSSTLYNDTRSAEAQETRATTAWVLNQILLILNPFMPFITEEISAVLNGGNGAMLIGENWPDYPSALYKESAIREIDWLTRLISQIRSVRADLNVPASARIPLLIRQAGAETQNRLKTYEEIIKRMARLQDIGMTDAVPKGALQTILDEATLILPVSDVIDLKKERERLDKELQKLEQEIKKIDQKLENKQFVDNAPEEIIDEQKTRRETAKSVQAKLRSALQQLAAA